MMFLWIKFWIFFFSIFSQSTAFSKTPNANNQPNIIYQSNFIHLRFPHKHSHRYPRNYYKNVTFSCIKTDSKGNVYVALPRFKQNVPFTLATYDESNRTFNAFPNFDFNNCNFSTCLNNVIAFDIDKDDQMWILDNPKFEKNFTFGTYKLIVFSLVTHRIIMTHEFSIGDEVFIGSSLTDISIDSENSIAYIVDSGRIFSAPHDWDFNSSIIVFDFDTEQVKRVLKNSIFTNKWKFSSKKKKICNLPNHLSSIALNCDFSSLYFASISDGSLYQLDTNTILMYNDDLFLNDSVQYMGKIPSSNGIIFSNKNNFFIADIHNSSILYTNEKNFDNTLDDHVKIFQEISGPSLNMTFPFKMGFGRDYLYVISNNFCDFYNNEIDEENMFNFVIWKFKVDENSISYGCDFSGYRISVIEISIGAGFSVGLVLCGIIVVSSEWVLQLIQKKKKEAAEREKQQKILERKNRKKKKKKFKFESSVSDVKAL